MGRTALDFVHGRCQHSLQPIERKPMFRFAGFFLAIVASLLAKGAVWAAISVQRPVLFEGHNDAFQMFFSVVNDGSSAINPQIERSHLLINGVEPKDWSLIIINGLRTPDFFSLPPGRLLQFSYALGRYFEKPGIYTVGWRGDNFKAADITIRVRASHFGAKRLSRVVHRNRPKVPNSAPTGAFTPSLLEPT
jgi:hypothetical protein